MSTNQSDIIDFWVCCGYLSTLSLSNQDKENLTVIWGVWGEGSCRKRYKGTIFGWKIDLNKKKRDTKEELKKRESYEELHHKDEIINNLKWKMCDEYVDLATNLQWLECSKTFCFDWLIRWIYLHKTWPNWNTELNKDGIRPNKEWAKIINVFKQETITEKDPLCKIHNIEAGSFWREWKSCVWNKWIISKNHFKHKILSIEKTLTYYEIKATKILSGTGSISKHKDKAINEISYLELINSDIFEIAFDNIYRSIANVKSNFMDEKTKRRVIRNQVFKADDERKNEIKELLKSFKKTRRKSMIEEVANALKDINFDRKRTDRSIQNYNEKTSNSSLIKIKSPRAYTFKSNILKIEDKNIKVDYDLGAHVIHINKNDMSVSLKAENESQYWGIYLKLIVEENELCSLSENKIKRINNLEDGKVVLGYIIIDKTKENLLSKTKLNFTLLEWSFDEDEISPYVFDAEQLILNKMISNRNKVFEVYEEKDPEDKNYEEFTEYASISNSENEESSEEEDETEEENNSESHSEHEFEYNNEADLDKNKIENRVEVLN